MTTQPPPPPPPPENAKDLFRGVIDAITGILDANPSLRGELERVLRSNRPDEQDAAADRLQAGKKCILCPRKNNLFRHVILSAAKDLGLSHGARFFAALRMTISQNIWVILARTLDGRA